MQTKEPMSMWTHRWRCDEETDLCLWADACSSEREKYFTPLTSLTIEQLKEQNQTTRSTEMKCFFKRMWKKKIKGSHLPWLTWPSPLRPITSHPLKPGHVGVPAHGHEGKSAKSTGMPRRRSGLWFFSGRVSAWRSRCLLACLQRD